jgi:hypothetical protein
VETNGGIQTRKKTAPISSEPPDIGSKIASIRELYAIDKKIFTINQNLNHEN